MDLTAFGPYALNVRTNISSYGPRARLIRAYYYLKGSFNYLKNSQYLLPRLVKHDLKQVPADVLFHSLMRITAAEIKYVVFLLVKN